VEIKKIIGAGVLSAGLIGGGAWVAHEGFSEVGMVGHTEACQNSTNITADCSGVAVATPDSLGVQNDLAQAEAWTGVVMMIAGGVGVIATGGNVRNLIV